ncbi:hypothetical protein GIW50_16410 [Pseudomonas syringae]|jgi:hypothetical protein|uniref:Uncharacterized protein n=1 Tax=Pseudomonas syringae TaxID=317 RepID=A0A9Q3ZUG7_PSESX|nr:hypothetical protein [Pseudomonas syringae]MCF5063280.1 hypothetical protein [Pseudomonas syringae]MCF5073894.1 hypothetical protein [Pseudomonas syringae]MCF5119972.1 hypothetical protein [Pseudomonas syringae]MCF5378730.1 hypothetical protein [Pseudomonas syringae]
MSISTAADFGNGITPRRRVRMHAGAAWNLVKRLRPVAEALLDELVFFIRSHAVLL